MRPRYDMNGNDISHGCGGPRARISGRSDRGHIAADESRDQSPADGLPSSHPDIRSLGHGVGCLNGRNHPTSFYQAQGHTGNLGRRRGRGFSHRRSAT